MDAATWLKLDQSEPMRATMREPILNKTSAFTADPRFRHIVGQTQSTFSIREAMDEGYWIIVNLEKGKLGAHALTLGGLLFTMIKNALFTRDKRSLFTLYCDEIQNLVAYDSGIEIMTTSVERQDPRKTTIINAVSPAAIAPSRNSPVMESLTNTD